MQVLIMRHGEAESPFAAGLRDEDRQLTDTGHQQTRLAGEVLLREAFSPDLLWVSPYRRAQQTASNLLQSYTDIPLETQAAITPEGRPQQVLDLISKANVATLCLVSHQPLVANLVALLSGKDVFSVPSMAPASMVLLQAEELYAGLFDIIWHRHSPGFDAQY